MNTSYHYANLKKVVYTFTDWDIREALIAHFKVEQHCPTDEVTFIMDQDDNTATIVVTMLTNKTTTSIPIAKTNDEKQFLTEFLHP